MFDTNISIGSLADWFSGLASFSAVFTALYIAHTDKIIKIKARIDRGYLLTNNTKSIDCIHISATNINRRATTISMIGMQTGLFKKKYMIIKLAKSQYMDEIPKKLDDGQSASWIIPLDDKQSWITKLLSDKFIINSIDIHTLKLVVYTSNHKPMTFKPGKLLIQSIKEKYKELNINK